MKVMSGDRYKVARWIDNQFAQNSTFPAKCVYQRGDRSGISPQHIRAYREWSKTPTTEAALNRWVDEWLNEQDQQQLLSGINHQSAGNS